MFALHEQRSLASVVSILAHAGVVAAALAAAGHASRGEPPVIVVPESLLVVPATGSGAPDGPLTAPVFDPPAVPNPPNTPTIPGLPLPPLGPVFTPAGGGSPFVLGGGGDSGVVAVALTDEPPALLAAPMPAYPPLLRQAGIQGDVVVQAVIDTLGRAEAASLRVVRSANPGFDQPSLECVRRALFRPGRVGGRAVRVLVNVPLAFTLRR